MTTLTVKVQNDDDLPAVEAALKQMGLEFNVNEDDDDWGDLSEAEIEGIEAGIADAEAGRTHSHEYVMARINETLNRLRSENG
jgi:predicted transcriptional regulator